MTYESAGGDFFAGSSQPLKVLPSKSSFQPAFFSCGVSSLSAAPAVSEMLNAIPILRSFRIRASLQWTMLRLTIGLLAAASLAPGVSAQDTRVILLGTGTSRTAHGSTHTDIASRRRIARS